ncbi:hypothetical protein [Nonomuraea sp. NPDC049625]|uniref:hypothetical protein n=1 Tax=Nonomuraea sp. NPDC049625 TaxID=3155775 RepID=UPI00341E841F
MLRTLLTAVALSVSACTAAPSFPLASKSDPAGIVMGTKADKVLMVGILNRFAAYERSATPAQIRACTRRPSQRYPACLP